MGTALALASAVLVLAPVVIGCASTEEARPPSAAPAPQASWLEIATEGCAIGFSGPTLNPGDAIRRARREALSQLAIRSDGLVHVSSELLVSGSRHGGEFTRQDVKASVRDSRIVAMWVEHTSDLRSAGRVRHVYALSCHRGAEPEQLPSIDYPSWLLNVPERPGQMCALGVGGPTLDSWDQRDATLRDARSALAASLESKLEQVIIDTGERNPLVASHFEASERAVARAQRAVELEEEWSDEVGIGPLGLRNVLYGLVCVPI